MSYSAFVSYRHSDPDRQWAKWLHSGLETYRVPKRLVKEGIARKIGRVFRDEEELSASSDLSERIGDALEAARFLIVICSRNTPQSRWVNEEVKRFQAMGRADRLFALLIDGEPRDSFPPALLEGEPLAADVRPQPGESRRAIRKTALLKLLAAILGVPYDELRRREEQRARRRLSIIAAAGSVLSATLLGLSLFASWQWRRAELELRISRAQRLATEAQVAYVATPNSEAYGLATPQRGVLLALESLNSFPTIEGDLALRTGVRLLAGRALEMDLAEGDSLASVAAHAASLLLITAGGPRVFDVATRAYGEPGAYVPEPNAFAATAGDSVANVVARSSNGDMTLTVSESMECAQGNAWVFACIELHRTGRNTKLADLPHDWQVKAAAFSTNDQWLVTVTGEASADAQDPSATALVGHTIHIWEVPSGRERARIPLVHDGGIEQAILSPDRGWLATTSRTPGGKTLRLWPLWPDLLRREACRRLTRNLSPSEWQTFVGTRPVRPTCDGLPVVSE